MGTAKILGQQAIAVTAGDTVSAGNYNIMVFTSTVYVFLQAWRRGCWGRNLYNNEAWPGHCKSAVKTLVFISQLLSEQLTDD